MKEQQLIFERYSSLKTEGGQAILATVVDVKGSSYRLPGARMLIDEQGRSIGTVSGGCLENDVLTRAKQVLKTGKPTLLKYDTTQTEDSIFGFQMGCRGVIRVLLEAAQNNQSLEFLRDCFEQRVVGAMATLIDAPKDFPISTGAKIFARATETAEPTIAASDFQLIKTDAFLQNVFADLSEALSETRTDVKTYETDKGAIQFFIETIVPPVSLLLFGAGYDALPVVDFAKHLGWRVTVIDHRAGWANVERFPTADEIIVARAEDLTKNLFQDNNSVAVLMTHNYNRDCEILPRLLNSSVKYIGALGPKKRTEMLLNEIGGNFSEKQLARLHAPVGLDVGAETPEEIALAIVAEIRAVLANRTGGFLRGRRGGIH